MTQKFQHVPLDERTIHGAISLERMDDVVKPWRIHYEEKELYAPEGLIDKAEMPAGVRVTFRSDTTMLQLDFVSSADVLQFDVLIDDELHQTVEFANGEQRLTVTNLPSRMKKIDIYLMQRRVLALKQLAIETRATWDEVKRTRKKWITYGSSITQCGEAESPSLIWPAITANRLELDLTCLGYGGQCHFEPMLARMIRDTPADFISLCAGINSYGSDTYNKRSFLPILLGFIKIIREKQPHIPIVLMSAIYSFEREHTVNRAGFTLVQMREEVAKAVALLQQYGDEHVYYVNGLDVFGEADAHLLPDRLHPNAEGYKLMGKRLAKIFQPYVS